MPTIDKDVPMPPTVAPWGSIRPLLRNMAVGDSFDLAEFNLRSVKTAAAEIKGLTFTIRRSAPGVHPMSHRIWRIS
jgi:hypothetical protein